MSYQTPSTHPNALVSTLLPTDRPAEATAEHLERFHITRTADLTGQELPNTDVVFVTGSAGSLSIYLHKAGSFVSDSKTLVDDEGRAFILAQTLTATATNVAVENAIQVAITLWDAQLIPLWLEADTLSAAITLRDVALSLGGGLSADTLSMAVTFHGATLSGDWLPADTLSTAITFNDAVLSGGWIEADTLATAITLHDADLFLAGPLSAETLSVSVTFHDATLFLTGMNADTLSTAITLHDATLALAGSFILTSGDAQSGSDAIDLSGDEGPGSLTVSGS